MSLWERLRDAWPSWPGKPRATETTSATDAPSGDQHLALARESLRELLDDGRVPAAVRESLRADYAQVQALLDKLEHGHIHVAVFGRVSVGKSALLNALLGREAFATSPLHGETRDVQLGHWPEYQDGGLFLLDTPGIDEIDGEAREAMAREVAARADLVLFVVEGDLTETELGALRSLVDAGRPLLLVLNKIDRYRADERARLREALRQRTEGLLAPQWLVEAAASPAERLVLRVDAQGDEHEEYRQPPPDVAALKARLWELLEREGKTLAALNASLFAGGLSEQVAQRVLAARREVGEKVVRAYCLTKGVAVGLNPLPVADLVAAAAVDVSLIVHLSRLYGLPLTRREAGALIGAIGQQILLLMGTVWAVHFVSSALKLGSGGLATVVTASAQGAVAYYSTYVVGQAAERYLANGKSWGELGPKLVVREILDDLDRESLLSQARDDIRARLARAG